MAAIAAALLAPVRDTAAAERTDPPPAVRSDFDGDGFSDLAVGASGEDVGGIENAGAVTVISGSASGLGGAMTTWTQNTPGVLGSAATGDWFGIALTTGDFNGDGFADLAVGALFDDPEGIHDAGAVNVLYGSDGGLTAGGSEYWHQDSPGVVEAAEENDRFGARLASGDFNGDGFDDLAASAYSETVGTVPEAGLVIVLRGTADGLTGTGSQLLHQDRPGVPGTADRLDNFGHSLAAGNLGKGRFEDLAVGVWKDRVATPDDAAGAVNVFYGSANGLATTGSQWWNQDTPGMLDQPESPDRFGYSVAIGNFGGSGQADLAAGVPFEKVGSIQDAGAVSVIYGSPDGLTSSGNQLWHQASPDVIGTAEPFDDFGFVVAAGNLGATRHADLVVGVPREDAGADQAGVVHVLYGSPTGVTAEGNQLWYQGTEGVAGGPEEMDWFGNALAVGNFGRSAVQDLAVGVPDEDIGTISAAGAINVLYGSPAGVTVTGNQLFSQDTDGTDEAAEPGDIFGSSLASS